MASAKTQTQKFLTKALEKQQTTTRPKLAKGMNREWFVLDASKEPLGRLASKAARLLIGKNRADFSKDVDTGAVVVIINAEKLVLTGKKMEFKTYFRHTGRPGSMKTRRIQEEMAIDPARPVLHAVKRMLPKNRLQSDRAHKRLKIFAGEAIGITQKMTPAN